MQEGLHEFILATAALLALLARRSQLMERLERTS
jgi:hypothetical protein